MTMDTQKLVIVEIGVYILYSSCFMPTFSTVYSQYVLHLFSERQTLETSIARVIFASFGDLLPICAILQINKTVKIHFS